MGRRRYRAIGPIYGGKSIACSSRARILLAFGGTRTYHRMACAIEDAGFEIRDCIQWLYGSGFPKSHDVSKGIDRAAGAEREVIGEASRPFGISVETAVYGGQR